MKKRIKKIGKSLIKRAGYAVVGVKQQRGWDSEYLALYPEPNIVIDVGVGYGTFDLYNAFSNAKLYLFEPIEEYSQSLNQIKNNYNCTLVKKALGNTVGNITIYVDKEKPTLSSVIERTSLTQTDHRLEKRKVEVTTLDNYFQNINIEGDILLKIDTEGYELNILRGAKKLLDKVKIVIAEVSIAKRFTDSYSFYELISFMEDNNFKTFDILSVNPVKNDIGTAFLDILFIRKN